MAITVDNIAAGLYTAGGPRQIQQVLPTMEGAAAYHSMWKIAGPPKAAAGANPPAYTVGSGYIPTRATSGAVGQANPTNSLFLAFLRARAAVVGTLILAALFMLLHYHRRILLFFAPWLGGFGRSIQARWGNAEDAAH